MTRSGAIPADGLKSRGPGPQGRNLPEWLKPSRVRFWPRCPGEGVVADRRSRVVIYKAGVPKGRPFFFSYGATGSGRQGETSPA
jgi:hypothetical protein